MTFCKKSCIEQLYHTQIIGLRHSPVFVTSPELGKDSGFMGRRMAEQEWKCYGISAAHEALPVLSVKCQLGCRLSLGHELSQHQRYGRYCAVLKFS